jgi:hypothetical protein
MVPEIMAKEKARARRVKRKVRRKPAREMEKRAMKTLLEARDKR